MFLSLPKIAAQKQIDLPLQQALLIASVAAVQEVASVC